MCFQRVRSSQHIIDSIYLAFLHSVCLSYQVMKCCMINYILSILKTAMNINTQSVRTKKCCHCQNSTENDFHLQILLFVGILPETAANGLLRSDKNHKGFSSSIYSTITNNQQKNPHTIENVGQRKALSPFIRLFFIKTYIPLLNHKLRQCSSIHTLNFAMSADIQLVQCRLLSTSLHIVNL